MTDLSDKVKLAIKEAVEDERDRSDKAYAIKLVEVIVFSMLGVFGTSIILYVVNLLFKK